MYLENLNNFTKSSGQACDALIYRKCDSQYLSYHFASKPDFDKLLLLKMKWLTSEFPGKKLSRKNIENLKLLVKACVKKVDYQAIDIKNTNGVLLLCILQWLRKRL